MAVGSLLQALPPVRRQHRGHVGRDDRLLLALMPSRADPDVAKAVLGELVDQRTHLKLIASENCASPAVLLAMGNWLSDKDAEGAPGRRLCAGCDNATPSSRGRTNSLSSFFRRRPRVRSPTAGSTPTLSPFGRAVPACGVTGPERLATSPRE